MSDLTRQHDKHSRVVRFLFKIDQELSLVRMALAVGDPDYAFKKYKGIIEQNYKDILDFERCTRCEEIFCTCAIEKQRKGPSC